jgi:hypothetical protein
MIPDTLWKLGKRCRILAATFDAVRARNGAAGEERSRKPHRTQPLQKRMGDRAIGIGPAIDRADAQAVSQVHPLDADVDVGQHGSAPEGDDDMSISGILSSVISSALTSQTQSTQNPRQQFQQEFQQLGKDLESGNLSAAQTDFATLQQNAPPGSPLSNATSSSTSGTNSLANAFSQLSQDLQAGNLSGAQSDFSTLQQDLQSQGAHAHHHHGGGEGGSGSAINQEFQALGQALQSGSLSGAQQAYTALQQDFQQFQSGGAAGLSTSSSQTASPNISVNA